MQGVPRSKDTVQEPSDDERKKGARTLSRSDAAILAGAFKTAKSQIDPDRPDPDRPDLDHAEPDGADRDKTEPDRADNLAVEQTGQPNSGDGFVEIHPSLPKVNPNLVFGATMALFDPPRFTPQELIDTINEILEGTGASAEFDEQMKQSGPQQKFSLLKRRLKGPPSAMLRVNGLFTLVGGGDGPAFVGKALQDRVNPALWSEGVQRLSKSRGHVMIADAHAPNLNDPDLNYDRAVAVTVTAAAVSLLTDPAGIIWHPAGNATPPDVIPDFVQSLADGLAPLPLWLRWLLVPPDVGRNPGAASRGLQALLGMEMELAPNDFSLEKTVNDLFQLAAVHVRSGKAPANGAQVGTKDKTWYHVVHHEHSVITNTPVFRLTPISDYSGD